MNKILEEIDKTEKQIAAVRAELAARLKYLSMLRRQLKELTLPRAKP